LHEIQHILATTGTGDPLLDWVVNNATAVGLLAFMVVGFIRGWIVTGRENARVIAERDRALEIVYAQAEATSRALDVAEKVRGN
jgi:hypothetical protein